MFMRVKDFIFNHFDFKFYGVSILALVVALMVVPFIMYLPPVFGYENGVLENIQLFVLFLGAYFALRTKTDKKFFIFVTLVLGILFLREINCGRTIFFPIPGEVNSFYSWKEIKYGYLAHPLFGLYMAFVGVYFLKNKLFITLWNKIKDIKMPFWNILFLLIGMIWGTYAEEVAHHFVMEEITELLFYTALSGIIYLYSQNEKFIEKEK